jgi:hypothetical protein
LEILVQSHLVAVAAVELAIELDVVAVDAELDVVVVVVVVVDEIAIELDTVECHDAVELEELEADAVV